MAPLAAERGYAVAVNFSTGEAEAATGGRLRLCAGGGRAVAIQADVSSEEADRADVRDCGARVGSDQGTGEQRRRHRRIRAGGRRFERGDRQKYSRSMSAGTILCAREAVRRMSTRRGGTGGAIVNISSRAAHTGAAGEWVHYAASKGAIDSFTIGLAREVATEGIRVNAVAPGLVETGLHAANGEPGRLQRLMGTIPMGRAGMPHEVAEGSAVAAVSGGVVHDGGDSGDWRRDGERRPVLSHLELRWI